MSNIAYFSFLDRVRIAFKLNLEDPANATPDQFVQSLEESIVNNPNEWVLYYKVADKYQEVGRYVDALRVCQKCVDLRPNDIRSVNALATAYNLLTRASWSEPREKEVIQLLKDFAQRSGDKLDPILSQAALDKTEMLMETAALQAIRWFEKSLNMKPDSVGKTQIEQDLKTLYARFPNLRQ